jgi:mRNA-degrading endonuclease RelE of RelBE toxin-antitoxin system
MIFIEDHGFPKRRKGLLDDEELFALLDWLAAHPEVGKVIRASGGLRKVRWAAKGHGKRGGVRVIYFWWIADDRILLLDIYAKGDQEDLAAADIEKLRRKVIE